MIYFKNLVLLSCIPFLFFLELPQEIIVENNNPTSQFSPVTNIHPGMPESSQISASFQVLGEFVYSNRYYVFASFLILGGTLLVIHDVNVILETPLFSPDPTESDVERIRTLMTELPKPNFHSFQQALYIAPELQATQNSQFLPNVITVKYEFYGDGIYRTPDGP